MKMSEQFAGNYFKASDLAQPRVLTITAVIPAKMPEGDTKPALQFAGESQQLVLNKTNAFICVDLFGDESTAWYGRQVELYATQTSYSGRMVPCIRVRQPQQVMQQPVYQVPQPAPQPVQQALQPVPQPQVQQPMTAPDYPMDA